MRALILCLLLAGCAASPPVESNITWLTASNAEPLVLRDGRNCVIVTNRESTTYSELGAAVRQCMEPR